MPNTTENQRLGGKHGGGWHILLAATLSLAVAGCAGEDRCKLTRATQLPLTLEGQHLYTQVEINGRPAKLIVDTGADGTVLTNEAVARLMLPHPAESETQGYGIGGSRSLSTLRTAHFAMGGIGGTNLTFTVPFGDWMPSHGDGLLGMDILSRFELDMDLPEHKLILYIPSAGCSTPSAALDQPLYMLRMKQDYGTRRAVVEARVSGHSLRALLDSGAAQTMLFATGTRALGLDADKLAGDRADAMYGVGPDKVAVRRHVLEPVQVGELTISNMPVAVSEARSMEGVDMIMGIDFFLRTHLWLSFTSHSVIVQYPPKPSPAAP